MGIEEIRVGQRRGFLNEEYLTSLTSNIGYQVSITSYNEVIREEGLSDRAEISFSISDCSRNIFLDFDIDTEEGMRNSLFKLRTIISHCESMVEDLKKARLEILKGQKRLKEIKDAREK